MSLLLSSQTGMLQYALKQSIDQGFLAFSQRHGAAIEAAFAPLQDLLIGAEQALLATPWPLLLAALAALAWGASRRWPLALGSAATLAVLGLFGLWDRRQLMRR